MNQLRNIAGIVGASLCATVLAQPVPPLPEDVKPIRVSGLGIKVSDLERSKKFYTEVLGLKVGARVPAQGDAVEYLLGMTGDVRADTLIVIRKGEVKPGAVDFGADLLCMGAYSHSRLRQLILGGVTRHVLEKSNLPVMMCR